MLRNALILGAIFLGFIIYRAVVNLGPNWGQAAPPDWRVYSDQEHNFELYYPDCFVPVPNTVPPVNVIENALVGFRLISKRYYDRTNLDEALVIISAKKNNSGLAGCLEPGIAGMPDEQPWHRVIVNKSVYNEREFLDAGAGNFYRLISYRTLHNGICYTVIQFIHWSNIGVFTPGTVSPFGEWAVLRELERVARTFRFLH